GWRRPGNHPEVGGVKYAAKKNALELSRALIVLEDVGHGTRGNPTSIAHPGYRARHPSPHPARPGLVPENRSHRADPQPLKRVRRRGCDRGFGAAGTTHAFSPAGFSATAPGTGTMARENG